MVKPTAHDGIHAGSNPAGPIYIWLKSFHVCNQKCILYEAWFVHDKIFFFMKNVQGFFGNICGYDEIGRHIRFRFWWTCFVGVQVPLSVIYLWNPLFVRPRRAPLRSLSLKALFEVASKKHGWLEERLRWHNLRSEMFHETIQIFFFYGCVAQW